MIAYHPSWNSLRNKRTPEWFRNAKFGIYTHWGVYSVPATGPNCTWYPYNMYREGTEQYEHHVKTYGDPANFGYKDFIHLFTAEKFNADEWAQTFKDSGAQFAGPVGEHHDGFSMWDSPSNPWCAAKMGPKRDVVGELERAIRSQGMRFMVAMHHAENWWFYPHWRKEFDTSDPKYAGLYGEPHDLGGPISNEWFFDQQMPSKSFLDQWLHRLHEVVDRYSPDMVWFDFGISRIDEGYLLDFLSYYYNGGAERLVTYKDNHLAPNVAVLDYELGREAELTYHEWLTDSTVDAGVAWGYMNGASYKTPCQLIHYLIDNVSKNGNLLLNIGPKADGTLPEEAKTILKEMGQWLRINGEAIYGTTPWFVAGEGPARLEKSGAFNENNLPEYTAQDVRFTTKDGSLYAILLGWPKEPIHIRSLDWERIYPGSITSIRLLGSDEPIQYELRPDGIRIMPPITKTSDHACAFKIERRRAYSK